MPNQLPQIANRSLTIIQEYADTAVEWSEFEPKGDMVSSMLVPKGVPPLTRNNENGNPVVVIALKNGFFLHMNIAFDRKKPSQLRSLSIQYYDVEDQLLRVDWSYSDLQKGSHPQPHWHMSPQLKGRQERLPMRSFEEYNQPGYIDFVQEQMNKVELDMSRVHLYLAYSKNIKSLLFDTTTEVIDWLDYTMDYIDKQFCSLKNRSNTFNSAGV